jgi:uncharacterized membrane protein
VAPLIVAALAWVAIHLGLAGTRLRDVVVRRTGEAAFGTLFSVLSVVTLTLLIWAWTRAPTTLLWIAPDWLRWLLVLAMLPAFILFVASVSGRNPTMIGPRTALAAPAKGITRVTRHPMLWSFAIWAAVHLIGNGDTAAIVFFTAFLVTALAGMPSIDAKLARRDPASWQPLAAVTSVIPFVAIIQGRNRFVPGEIGWLTPGLGLAVWIAVLIAHPWLFGVAPVIW